MRDQIVDFLQDEKLDFDVIDNDFLHENGESLLGHKLLILFGHDEYWTHEMRQAVNHFSALGGRILNMSGNLMWFKVIKKEEKIFVNKLSEKEGRDEIESWTGKYLYVDPVKSWLAYHINMLAIHCHVRVIALTTLLTWNLWVSR